MAGFEAGAGEHLEHGWVSEAVWSPRAVKSWAPPATEATTSVVANAATFPCLAAAVLFRVAAAVSSSAALRKLRFGIYEGGLGSKRKGAKARRGKTDFEQEATRDTN